MQQQPVTPRRVNGRLRLRFAYDPAVDQTVLVLNEQQPPLRVVRAFHLDDGAALAHLHNLSGGVLGGDQLELDVTVGPRAHVQLTTTGATRVYRQRAGQPAAVQINRVNVQADGLLEYLPDPLIPFANASYRQETRIDLSPGAGLFWWETVAPGREARGEVFAFDCVHTRLDLAAQGRLLAMERTRIAPGMHSLASLARLGPYRHYANFYICRLGLAAERWLELEMLLGEMAQQCACPGEVLWGVSSLPAHGLIVRALSCTGRAISAGLLAFWRMAKLELYGREPIPPRKVY